MLGSGWELQGYSGTIYVLPELDEQERDVRAAIQQFNDALALQVRQSNRWTAPLRRMTFARNVQGSNSIEGINASVDDVAAIAQGEQPATVDEDTERALAGYQLAMTYVLQLAQNPVVIDSTLIRSLHFRVASHDLGLVATAEAPCTCSRKRPATSSMKARTPTTCRR